MTICSDNRRRARWLGYIAISIAIHAVIFAFFRAPKRETVVTTITLSESELPERTEEEREEVEVVEELHSEPNREPDAREAVEPLLVMPTAPLVDETPPVLAVMEPAPPVLAEPEPEPEAAPEVPENLRSVFQPDRDAEAPEVASALAEFDNSTDVETMPEETVDWTEDSGQNEDANEADAPVDEALSVRSPSETQEETESLEEEAAVEQMAAEEREQVALGSESGDAEQNLDAIDPVDAVEEEAPEEVVEWEESEPVEGPGPSEPVSPLNRFRPQHAIAVAERAAREGRLASVARGAQDGATEAAYDNVFGARDERDSERVAAEAREASLVGDHEALWEHTRRALENYDVSVTPGSELSLNTRSDEAAAYIHYLHDKIHDRWWNHLSQWNLYAGPTSPLSDYSLVVELEFGIRRDGEVEHVSIANGSGSVLFDGPAIGLLWEIGPHRPPPPGLIGSDGNAHVRWAFHRDNRGCISSGASVHRVQESVGEGG